MLNCQIAALLRFDSVLATEAPFRLCVADHDTQAGDHLLGSTPICPFGVVCDISLEYCVIVSITNEAVQSNGGKNAGYIVNPARGTCIKLPFLLL